MGLVQRSLRREGSALVGAMRFSLSRFLSSAFAVLVSCHVAIAAEAEFYSQCHKLFPVADDFAHECLQRARPFSRTFYPSGGNRGEAESFSTYFKALDAPSHFVLGCVLDFKHKISFAGLYYSAQPLDMARFNEYPIAFIDFDGNVGLKIDGAQHTLIAARQFVTDVIPPRLRGRPQNCEDPRIETMNGSNATALHRFRKIDENHMEYCYGNAPCKIQRYSTFGGVHEVQVIYENHDLYLIDGNGVLMLREDYFKNICALKERDTAGVYNIIYEACTKAK
jgi:hypothetical protein